MNLTYRYRVKNLSGELSRQARAVNFVWNYCNDVQQQAVRWSRRWPTGFDLINLTSGSSRELNINSDTISAVCQRYVYSRNARQKHTLKWRTEKSLGWIPLRGRTISRTADGFKHNGKTYRVFDSRPLPPGKIRDGSAFARDAKGNWYLNIVLEADEAPLRSGTAPVGIDLGLKALGTLSSGESIQAPQFLRKLEARLASAQRAHKRRLAKNIHGHISNARRDFLHKFSTRIVRQFDYIAVGNVNAAGLAKTSMAKSVLDAGWSTFRNQLAYKALRHGAIYEEVNEAYSTQTCSDCGSISGPKGRKGLVVREWTCGDCGATHDRDVNAARNILLRSGHRAHVDGTAKERKCQIGRRDTIPASPHQGEPHE